MSSTDSWLSAGNSDPANAPLPLELLADLHAGVLDAETAAALRDRVATDAQARTVLAALDATVADLAALPTQRSPRMPDAIAHRLDAALAAEAQRNRPPGDSAELPGKTSVAPLAVPLAARQHRRVGWVSVGMLTAAAAVVGVMALTGIQLEITGIPRPDDALGTASGVQGSEAMALTSTNVLSGNVSDALDQALRARDFGPLSEAGRLQCCLAANNVATDREPLGGLEVTLDGRPGVLIVLPTDRIAQFALLVVGPDCGPGNPSQLAITTVGRR